ncbi:MAG: DUF1877 family protein [Spirulina sp. SIO3F2]|nr:DUF1877 family protein [Spirulina sp. SIO3F2]
MGITMYLQQISLSTLETLEQFPEQSDLILELLESVMEMPESEFYTSAYKEQFVVEWEKPELDLQKHFTEINYFLAGYIEEGSETFRIPELKGKELDFLVINDSKYDGLPLVNLIWYGLPISKTKCQWLQKPEEVITIKDALLTISESGFRARIQREMVSEYPYPDFMWEEEEFPDWITDYYNQLTYYYCDAAKAYNAMLITLSV